LIAADTGREQQPSGSELTQPAPAPPAFPPSA